jgi:hypothetical protein
LNELRYGAPHERPLQPELITRGSAFLATLFLAVGAAFGELIGSGWMTPLAASAIGLTLMRWPRFPLCRDYFLASIAMIAVGTSIYLLMSDHPVRPTRLALGARTFWASFFYAFLRGRFLSPDAESAANDSAAAPPAARQAVETTSA